MPCCASVAARFLPENHGKRRENGVERTSATAFTPAWRNSPMKRSAGIFEWPMLNRSNDDIVESLAKTPGSFMAWQMINRRYQVGFFARSGGATMLPLSTWNLPGGCNAPVALCDCRRRVVFDLR